MAISIEGLKKRVDAIAEVTARNNGALICLPDNGRDSFGIGRNGSIIIYDNEHPPESFMSPEERGSTQITIDEEGRIP